MFLVRELAKIEVQPAKMFKCSIPVNKSIAGEALEALASTTQMLISEEDTAQEQTYIHVTAVILGQNADDLFENWRNKYGAKLELEVIGTVEKLPVYVMKTIKPTLPSNPELDNFQQLPLVLE